jgi:hypothetical protein
MTAGTNTPEGVGREKRAVFPQGRSCPDNRTAGISLAIFIFNRHLCREMPDNIRLRSDRIARKKLLEDGRHSPGFHENVHCR